MAYVAARPKTKGKYRGRGYIKPTDWPVSQSGTNGDFPRHNRGQGND